MPVSGETYAAVLRRRYPWITGLEERRSDDSFEETLVVTAEDGAVYPIPVSQSKPWQFQAVVKRLDEITYNRMVEDDTADWTDAP